MPAYEPHADGSDGVDWRLASNSFVSLFWRRSVMDESLGWLREHGYHIVSLDAGGWATEATMHHALAEALDFPDYYGKNLNALNDCLGDVASLAYGSREGATGLVVALDRFDRFMRQLPRAAPIVLDIFASQARVAALVGHRMLCLVRSDDTPTSSSRPLAQCRFYGTRRNGWNPNVILRGWRGPTASPGWRPIPICLNCQLRFPPSLFPPGTMPAPGGVWPQP